MSFWSELRRRHMVKIALGYLATGAAVLQGADFLLPTMDVPAWTYDVIVAVVVLGFPIAVAVGWALTMSPEGEVHRVRSGSAAEPPRPAPNPRSVAVLPFADLSPDGDHEYFSDGITEEILMSLSRVRGLHVISRTSVMQFKQAHQRITEIAEALGVVHVVEGSVRRAGERIRITAQLIDARTDAHVWAESYDRDVVDVFEIQSDVATRIVQSLQGALTPRERAALETHPTESVEAYSSYLRGRHLLADRIGPTLTRARQAFEDAIELDADFALAWAGRAETAALLAHYKFGPVAEMLAEARRSARRALALRPDLAQAHSALGLAAFVEWDFEESDRHHRQALEHNPGHATTHHWYGVNCFLAGRFDEARLHLERALELDPVAPLILIALGEVHRLTGRFDEAERVLRRVLEIDPGNGVVHINMGTVYRARGEYGRGIEELDTWSRLHPEFLSPEWVARLKRALEKEGERGMWEEYARSARQLGEFAVEEAEALVRLGRIDPALDVIERWIEARHFLALEVRLGPEWAAPLEDHPRFRALMARIGPADPTLEKRAGGAA